MGPLLQGQLVCAEQLPAVDHEKMAPMQGSASKHGTEPEPEPPELMELQQEYVLWNLVVMNATCH